MFLVYYLRIIESCNIMHIIIKTRLLLFLISITISSVSSQILESSHFCIDIKEWESIETITDGYTISSFLDEAERYYEYIYTNLKISKMINSSSKKCRIYIVESGVEVNRCIGNAIYLDKSFIGKKFTPLAHEITHLILYCKSLESLSEGLADYYQNYFITKYRVNEQYYNGNVHEKIKVVWKNDFSYNRLENILDGYLSNYFSIIEAQSFVQFIIEKYGMVKFIKYFDGGGYVSYEKIFDKNRKEILEEWIEYINSVVSNQIWEDNWEEINEYYFPYK